jgi:hypothetical protein
MLNEHLVREQILAYYESLNPNDYAGRPSDRFDCPFVRYLKSLNIVDPESISMDYTHIWFGAGKFELLPAWVRETVQFLNELDFNSLSGLRNRDIVGVLNGSIVAEEKVFLFTELPEKIQDKLYQQFVESLDMTDWADDFVSDLEIDLENELQGDKIEIRYSVGSGQGDGASFTGKINISTFISDVTGTEHEYPLLVYVIANNDLYDDYVEVYSTNNHYVHAHSVNVGKVEVSGNARDIEDYLEEEIDNLQSAMKDWIVDRSNEIYNEIENHYESLISFESFRENEIDMENYYYADGTLVE